MRECKIICNTTYQPRSEETQNLLTILYVQTTRFKKSPGSCFSPVFTDKRGTWFFAKRLIQLVRSTPPCPWTSVSRTEYTCLILHLCLVMLFTSLWSLDHGILIPSLLFHASSARKGCRILHRDPAPFISREKPATSNSEDCFLRTRFVASKFARSNPSFKSLGSRSLNSLVFLIIKVEMIRAV